MLTATHKINFQTGRNTKKVIGSDQKPQPEGRLPRITKMMALAIRLDDLIKTGQVNNQAELARLFHLSSLGRSRETCGINNYNKSSQRLL